MLVGTWRYFNTYPTNNLNCASLKKTVIQALLFDFDGVLAKSNELYVNAYLGLFKRYGIRVKKKDLLAHFGEDHRALFQHFVPKERFTTLYNVYHRAYHKEVLTLSFYRHIHLLSGVRTMLQRLGRGYLLGICTGCPRKTLLYLKNNLGLKHSFDYLSCADDVQHGKPAPDLLLRALRILRIKPSEALYIGDAPRDYLCAKRARVPFVAVLSGVLTRSMCKKLGVKHILLDVTQLPRFLEKLN